MVPRKKILRSQGPKEKFLGALKAPTRPLQGPSQFQGPSLSRPLTFFMVPKTYKRVTFFMFSHQLGESSLRKDALLS